LRTTANVSSKSGRAGAEMDRAGFEPAASALRMGLNSSRICQNKLNMKVNLELLQQFAEYMRVNMRLEERTVIDTVEGIKRYLKRSDWVVSYETASAYLKTYICKSPKTYNSQITLLRRFIRDFLHSPQDIVSFKMAPVDYMGRNIELPTRAQMKSAFDALKGDEAKTTFLFFATTGLRKNEILTLTVDKINLETRAVIPQHFTRVKRSGITFFNAETETWLKKFLNYGDVKEGMLFNFIYQEWGKLWRIASKAAGVRITPQVLRVWFSMEMGEQGIPDRFVDIFQGRAPRSVLAKHYTAKGIGLLSNIYAKANLGFLE
jgi:intergrase/recombinase